MKKIVFALAIMAVSTALNAQVVKDINAAPSPSGHSAPPPEMVAQRVTERIGTDLNLTTDQKSRLYKVNLEFVNQMNGAKRAHDKVIMKQAAMMRDKQYKTIFTPDQYSKYESKRMESKMEMKERAANAPKNGANRINIDASNK
ncbi:MAG: DUF4890 domain-containing protein [Taibaiella sp.]|nr:DUF4890 domain-containing protein [Taibaiella sp.]